MKKFDKNQKFPDFIIGDCFAILKTIEPHSIDCVITSPPYFREREQNKHFNINQTIDSYIENILELSRLVKNVLKEEGSFWLNLGDSYSKCSLQLIPERVAMELIKDGWLLNNDIIWKKKTSTPTSYKKRLTNSYEHLYHFVLNKNFYYNLVALDSKKNLTHQHSGEIKTISDVTGVKYRKIIIESNILNDDQKTSALAELERCLDETKNNQIRDFRFLIKGHNKVVSSNRLYELEKNGFVVIKSRYEKPSDVWEINPEKDNIHYAPFPEELVQFPIRVSCPPKGIVLDPFCGSGTTNVVAFKNNKKSIGIDIKEVFIKYAKERCYKEN